MNEQLHVYGEKINNLNQRERVLIFLVALVIVVILLQVLLIDPLLKDRVLMTNEYQQAKSQLMTQNNEKMILEAEFVAGIHRESIKRREELKKELETLNKKVEGSIVTMIPPELMSEVLENILSENEQLKLLSIENKPVTALVESKNDKENNHALYKHAFVLTLKGSYLSTITYFEKLGALPWRFHWDDMLYSVESYPNAIIKLEVHTVSMSQEWIGV